MSLINVVEVNSKSSQHEAVNICKEETPFLSVYTKTPIYKTDIFTVLVYLNNKPRFINLFKAHVVGRKDLKTGINM